MEKQNKDKKRNITLMIILALMFIIGIAIRWSQTKSAIMESIESYF